MSQPQDGNTVDEERVDVTAVPAGPDDRGDVPPAESGGVGIGRDAVPDTFEPEEPQ